MSKIKKLPENIINLISAGEVVEKPSSVIKELVENSIDAGASQIEIFIERSGKNKIIVIDNGLGMSSTDLLMSIERHATSKLDENNIMNITHFGFRGEALAAISSVSRIQISSRFAGDNSANKLIKQDNGTIEIIEDSINQGTKIEINDLFFSTPARLKFLKSDSSELISCFDTIKKLAIAHPDVTFSVTSNNKLAFKYHASSLEERISKILPKDFTQNAAYVDFSRDDVRVTGFVSIPTYNRATSSEQYLFVNNRPVKDKLLISALKVAYKDFLENGRSPVVVIFIDIDHEFVDVNVHPAKIEIRFQDPNSIRSILIASIRDALSKESHKTSSTLATKALDIMNNNFTSSYFTQKFENFPEQQVFNTYLKEESQDFEHITPRIENNQTQLNFVNKPINIEKPILFEAKEELKEIQISETKHHHSLGTALTQFYNTYILSQTEDAVILIDQHAAHERLVYEDLKNQLEKNGITRQTLLIPEIIEFHDIKYAHQIYNKKDDLLKLGLKIDLHSEYSIIVLETPALLGDFDIKAIVSDIGEYLISFEENFALSHLIEHVTETYSCHNAIRAGRKMNLSEMNALIHKMEITPFSGQCNHGRPTYLKLNKKDIERLFGRR